ncbi:MAG: class I fructose-bisphosphate aldolase [Rhodospirillaceae bacterium]|nr:class I fructose-bisphosphate aldolase [Rhodospirillaceae bacterium]
MKTTQRVKKILSCYESDNPGTKANLARILMAGKLGGTGKMVILPVDQGLEHGPARSFSVNVPAYDPHYLFQLALDAGLNAYAAPLGPLEAGADTFAGQIPLILKVNSSNSLARAKEAPDQGITASVHDALRIGANAIGFTIYPGSDLQFDMIEEIREMSAEAKYYGIPSVVWSYPRGGALSKAGELGIDIGGYAAYIAAAIGAHIIKVKLPSEHIEQPEAQKAYDAGSVAIATQAERVRHVMQCAFNGRRIVVFSGGATKGADAVFEDARAIRDGGGNGSIIGRNSFQRSREDALALLDRIVRIYKGQED